MVSKKKKKKNGCHSFNLAPKDNFILSILVSREMGKRDPN